MYMWISIDLYLYTLFVSFRMYGICFVPNIRHLIVNDNVQIDSVDMEPNQSPSQYLNLEEPNRADEPDPAQLPRDEPEVFESRCENPFVHANIHNNIRLTNEMI